MGWDGEQGSEKSPCKELLFLCALKPVRFLLHLVGPGRQGGNMMIFGSSKAAWALARRSLGLVHSGQRDKATKASSVVTMWDRGTAKSGVCVLK